MMDEDSLARKTYNFICGSGGILSVCQLVKKPSPLERLQTEEEVRKWLRVQTEKDRRFVLIMAQGGKVTGLRIDLRKKICSQYWLQGSCNRLEGKCKHWHICRNYIEGKCEGSCNRSHDFHDDVNEWKVKELELEKFDNGAIRNIVAGSLPQVCLSHVRGECFSVSCPYLHFNCSVEAPGESAFSFASTSQLTDVHNKAILKQFDLVPHKGMKVEFVQCNILVPYRQKKLEATNCSSADSEDKEGNVASTRYNENINDTSARNQDLSKMTTPIASESQELRTGFASTFPSQDIQICSRQEETSFSKRKRRGRKKSTEQHQIKVERNKSEPFVGYEEESNTPVSERNNLGEKRSWKCSQMIPDFLNIQDEGKQKSLVASVNDSKIIHTKEQFSNLASCKNVTSNSSLGGQVVSPTPSNIPLLANAKCSNTIASLDKMSSQKQKVMSNADGARSLVMNGEERFQDSPVTEKLHDQLAQVLFQCLCKEYSCSAPFPALQKRKDLSLSSMEDARSWLGAHTDKFVTIEDNRGNIKRVTAFCPKLRLCFAYVKSGKCSKTECSYFHLCKQYITGHCDRGENCDQNHQFQNELDKHTLSILKLDWLTNEQLRQLMRSSVPQVCNDYNKGRCVNAISTCPRMHICKMYVSGTCKDGIHCHLAHEMAVETEHARSFLGKYRLANMKTEQILKMILDCGDTVGNKLSEKKRSSKPRSAGASCGGTPIWIPDCKNITMLETGFNQKSCTPPHSRFEHERVRKSSVSSSCSSTMERSNENLPSKKAVFECICKEYSCSVSFAVISERNDLFQEGCGNVASWFREKRDSFMLDENEDGTINEVIAVCRRARLCFNHSTNKKCSKDSCQYLHLCRAYAAGCCRFGNRCIMEHSFQNEKDRKLISKLKLDGLTDEELRKVVQNSSPQVCLEYNDGLCPKGDKCSRIHICKNFVKGKCDHDDACFLGHEVALKTSRAREILKKYDIRQELPVNTIRRMLLLSDAAPLLMRTPALSIPNTETGSTTPTKVVDTDHENRDWLIATTDQDKKPEPVPVPRFSTKTLSAINNEPSESKVFEALCKDYNCSVQFSVIAKRKDLFPGECKDIEYWFRKWKSSFLITDSSNGSISSIDAFSARARLCLSYINSGACVKSNCSYLHMCRDYITDNCIYGATCTRNHSFHNEKDETFLANVKLDQLTNEQLRKLVLSSALQVCLDYNNGLCDRDDSCTRIHVCKDFLKKNCKNGYQCDFDHESALATYHTQTVLDRYHLSEPGSFERQNDVLLKRILVCDSQDWSGKNNGHVHKNKPKTPICSDFLLGKCTKGIRCSGHHCSRPFQWQYKVPRLEEWKSFNGKDNDTLEKLFCDPSEDEIRLKGLRVCLDSTGILACEQESQAVVYLEDRLMILSEGLITQIRRLSTESCVTNPSNPLATNWIWRWEDEHGLWMEYRDDCYGQDLQKLIEAAYVNQQGPAFSFSMQEHDYQVYFHQSMFQQNVRYQTKRNVRRRPLTVVTDEDLLQLKSQNRGAVSSYAKKQQQQQQAQSGTLPSHWSQMSPSDQFVRVKLAPSSSEFQKVQTLFTKTIREYVRIVSIERVQNPFMWEKFRRKKENMTAVKTRKRERESVNERQLFHGTSPDAVTAICKQNFDWRLHGKNATMYGEGSYFAVNASYSNNYAKADADSYRYMFLANVLVGSYTKGHSSFRRPPPIQPSNPESDLYDSCVDNGYNPMIFVVFDTDQFYPAYVIKYLVTSLSAPAIQHFRNVPPPSWPSTAVQNSPGGFTAPSAYPASSGRSKDKCSVM